MARRIGTWLLALAALLTLAGAVLFGATIFAGVSKNLTEEKFIAILPYLAGFLLLGYVCTPAFYRAWRERRPWRWIWLVGSILGCAVAAPLVQWASALLLGILLDSGIFDILILLKKGLPAAGKERIAAFCYWAVLLSPLVALLAAVFTLRAHRRRSDSADGPLIALGYFWIAFSLLAILAFALMGFSYAARQARPDGTYPALLAYPLFGLAVYLVQFFFPGRAIHGPSRLPFAAAALHVVHVPVLVLGAVALSLGSTDSTLPTLVLVPALLPFLFWYPGDLAARLRAALMMTVLCMGLFSVQEQMLQNLKLVLDRSLVSLPALLLFGWFLEAWVRSRGDGRRVARVVSLAAWILAAAFLVALELYYGTFTDRQGLAASVAGHLAALLAGYAVSSLPRWITDMSESPDGLARPVWLTPALLGGCVLLALGALLFGGRSYDLTAQEFAGVRLGASAEQLGAAPGKTLILEGRVTGRRLPGRFTRERTKRLTAWFQSYSASCIARRQLEGTHALQNITLYLSPAESTTLRFSGVRIPLRFSSPGDLVALQKGLGAQLYTSIPEHDPLQGGLIFFHLGSKARPSILSLMLHRRGPGDARLVRIGLSVGWKADCMVLRKGEPNLIAHKDLVGATAPSDETFTVIARVALGRSLPRYRARARSRLYRGMIVEPKLRYVNPSKTEDVWYYLNGVWFPSAAMRAGVHRVYGERAVPSTAALDALHALSESGKCMQEPLPSVWRVNQRRHVALAAKLRPAGSVHVRLSIAGAEFLDIRLPRSRLKSYGLPKDALPSTAASAGGAEPYLSVMASGMMTLELGTCGPKARGAGGSLLNRARSPLRFQLHRLRPAR